MRGGEEGRRPDLDGAGAAERPDANTRGQVEEGKIGYAAGGRASVGG